jgi:hypothetical protein
MLVPTVILAMFDLEQAKQIYRARAKRHGLTAPRRANAPS